MIRGSGLDLGIMRVPGLDLDHLIWVDLGHLIWESGAPDLGIWDTGSGNLGPIWALDLGIWGTGSGNLDGSNRHVAVCCASFIFTVEMGGENFNAIWRPWWGKFWLPQF